MFHARVFCFVVGVLAVCTALATSAFAQQSSRVDQWSARFEHLRSQINQVADDIERKAAAFRAKNQAPGEFYEEIQKCHEQNQRLHGEIQAIHDEIQASREGLDKQEYKRAYEDYRQTYKEYQATYKVYQAAYRQYNAAQRKYRETEHASRDAARNAEDNANKQLADELDRLERTGLQPGSQAIALVDTQLKLGTQAVGHAREGEKLAVQRVQGEWLYVGNGWIHKKYVVSAALMQWYQGLPDNSSVGNASRARGKFDGVMFEIVNAGSQRLNNNNFGPNNRINGQSIPSGGGMYINSPNVGVFLRKAGDRRRELMIAFPGSRNIFPVISALRSHGMIEQGDYVCITTDTRQVSVNGRRR